MSIAAILCVTISAFSVSVCIYLFLYILTYIIAYFNLKQWKNQNDWADDDVFLFHIFIMQVKYLGSENARGLWGIKHTRRPVDHLVSIVIFIAATIEYKIKCRSYYKYTIDFGGEKN